MNRWKPLVRKQPRPVAKVAIIAWPDGKFEVQAEVPSIKLAIHLLDVAKKSMEKKDAEQVLMGRQSLVVPDALPSQNP